MYTSYRWKEHLSSGKRSRDMVRRSVAYRSPIDNRKSLVITWSVAVVSAFTIVWSTTSASSKIITIGTHASFVTFYRLIFHDILPARLMGQYCFAHWRLSSSVTLPAARRAGERPPPCRPPGAWAVRRPTLHGGPVRLRPVRPTPCFILRCF